LFLNFTLGGGGVVGTDRVVVEAPARTVALWQPDVPQFIGTAPESPFWEQWWLHVQPRPRWHRWLRWPSETPGFAVLRDIPAGAWQAILDAGNRCRGRAFAGKRGLMPCGTELAMTAAEEIILLLWGVVHDRGGARPLDERIARALDMIAETTDRAPTVGELARAVGLSSSRFAHLFRRQVGRSVQSFVETTRLQRARELLELGGVNVSEAARACGFSSPFYFSTRFRKLFGVPPSSLLRGEAPEP
jgi:AraC family transcriptional regulator of arabinose operon